MVNVYPPYQAPTHTTSDEDLGSGLADLDSGHWDIVGTSKLLSLAFDCTTHYNGTPLLMGTPEKDTFSGSYL